ncbi:MULTISPECIES: metalloregulator ArsR/SmtB family transcription factor [Paenibacillus]|uniref:Transcriptional regulator n=2 Tax=Paenibacillus TaxID=44249 RepID=A0ABT2UL98_9BACL|nr:MULTISPECIES: metalloregulator ArsR/SmtB family transcription factor [unclassified Paenibacillus]MCU6794652.1 transcriptional regulator [Paenibacillus sp. WQ 127069]OMF19488.1 ArsR family transcriptional regulator [Paenibacillus sp. FSL H7-0331]
MTQEFDMSTRRVVLTMLKTKGPLAVSEIAKQLGITEMAVRRHLNTLERDGLIESKLVRQAMGRPTNLYSLTESADELFPKNYYNLTLDLLGELVEEAGEAKVQLLFERRKEKMIDRYEEQMQGKELGDRVKALAEIQNANGYMVNWSADEDGTFVINEHNCPISQVANQYNHACHCELMMFETLLGADVKRTECLVKGGLKCSYSIQAK